MDETVHFAHSENLPTTTRSGRARGTARHSATSTAQSGAKAAAQRERTRTNDPERTKAEILAVAKAEFAEKGLDGARIDEIAAATRTSKRMIYYYFESKEGLFERLIQDGRIQPMPFAQVMGLSIPQAERGRVTFSFHPSELWENPMGTLHGGAIGTLLDSAMGMAVLSTLDQGVSYTTLEYKVNFMRPVLSTTGEVFAEGAVLHEGRSQAVVEARLTDANGKLFAMASSTCAILR